MRAAPIRALFSAAAAALCACASAHADPELHVAVGAVEIASGNPANWRPARAGDRLRPGDALRTGAGARAELETSTGTIRLYERSTLRVPPGPDDSSRLGLDRGAAIFDIYQPARRPFQVETPHAVVRVQGARFAVRDDEDGASVSVQRGLVSIRTPSGSARELVVHPGFGVSGGAGRSFALGLMPRGADAWSRWSRSARPPEPSLPPPETAPTPASMPGAGPLLDDDDARPRRSSRETPPGAASACHIRVLRTAGEDQVQIAGGAGLDVVLTERELRQVVSGNTALLGPQLLNVLGSRGVSPAVFATQMLDLLL